MRTKTDLGRVPLGRPPEGEERTGKPLSFVAYDEDLDALAEIEEEVGGAVRTRRSVAIRLAIREHAAVLRARKERAAR